MSFKYSHIMQENSNECGVVSLLMIIRHYKGNISLYELKDLTNTDKFGTSAYNLIKAAKYLNFNAIGVKVNINDLKKLTLPCIAHIIINENMYHYVVIQNINFKNNTITISDPNFKDVKTITINEFSAVTTNNYILLKPLTKIKYIKDTNILKVIISKILQTNKLLILMYIVLIFISLFIVIVSNYFIRVLIEGPLSLLNLNISIKFIFIIIIFNIVNIVVDQIINYINNYATFVINDSLYDEFTNKVFSLDKNMLNTISQGDLISITEELNNYTTLSNEILKTLAYDLILVIIILSLLYLKYNKLFIIFIIFIIIYSLFTFIFNKTVNNKINDYKSSNYFHNKIQTETFSSFNTIKSLQKEMYFINKLKINYYNFKLNEYKLKLSIYKKNTIVNLLNNMFLFIMYYYLIEHIIKENLNINYFIVFNSYYNLFLISLNSLSNYFYLKNELNFSKKKINSLFNINKLNSKRLNYNKNIKEITINNVYYKYDTKYIIRNFSLKIKNNDLIKLEGKSGSGKTTLMKLLLCDIKVTNGNIKINNININTLNDEYIKSKILYISNKEKIYNMSILNNIFLGSDIDVELLSKINYVISIDKVYKKPFGYDFILEEDGSNISQGEIQRVILARSLVKDFDLLILDEATSNLDEQSERKLLKYLKKTNKKTIVISHRNYNKDLYTKIIKL